MPSGKREPLIHSCNQSFRNILMSPSYMPDTVLGPGDTDMKKANACHMVDSEVFYLKR